MDNKAPVINLPFWESVRRSFAYFFGNWDLYLKVSAVWFVILIYELGTGLPTACNFDPQGCVGGWRQNLAIALLALASVAIVVAYIRGVILKAPIDYVSGAFAKRALLYVWYSLVFMLMVAVPSVAGVFVFAMVGQFLGLPESYFSFAILIPILVIIYLSRILLVFPAAAVDNSREISLGVSFRITVGNANKIFWGQVIMMLPAIGLTVILALLYKLLAVESFAGRFIFVALIYAVSFFDSCLKASYLAHLYQYFVFYYKQNPETAENK